MSQIGEDDKVGMEKRWVFGTCEVKQTEGADMSARTFKGPVALVCASKG